MIKTYIETRYIKPMSEHYFFVEDLSGEENTLSIKKNNNDAPTVAVEYSTDEQNWQTLGTTSRTALTYNIPANGRVYLRANATNWAKESGSEITYNGIKSNKNYKVGGNLLSLLYGQNFTGQETSMRNGTYTFAGLLGNPSGPTYANPYLIDASNLVIPVVNADSSAFCRMFKDCTNLVAPPVMSSLVSAVSSNVYGTLNGMFQGCTSLATAPDLSSLTTLGRWDFIYIFNGCTSLTIPPDLSSLTTALQFNGAFGLTGITSMPDLSNITTDYTIDSYGFANCTSLTTVPATCFNSHLTGIGGAFQQCTSLTSVDLSAMTTLTNAFETFYQCSNLNSVNISGLTTWDTNNTSNWLQGVAATGTIYINPALDGVIPENSASGIPSGWTKVVVS